MYYRNANCAVVVYDITQPASLEKARTWIRELQRQADPSIVITLCGNKLDLSARRQVTQEEAQRYAEEEGLMWGETSAKTGEGVADIFTALGLYNLFRYDIASSHLAQCYPAKKLPQVAPPPLARGAGAARSVSGRSPGVDLNNAPNQGGQETCNC